MAGVLEVISKLPALRELRQLVEPRGAASVVGCAGSGPAAVAAWLALGVRTHTLVVCAGVEEAEEFAEDVNLFHDGLACHFPALEVLPGDVERPSDAILRARLSVLRHLAFGDTGERGDQASDVDFLEPTPRTRIVCAAVTALLQPTASPQDLREGSLSVAVGDEAEPGRLVEWLVDSGYLSAPQVQLSGQYCLRGGILDVYSHGAPEPVRVEFFGDKVDSIRTFDPFSQLSTGRIQRCQVTVPERPAGAEAGVSGSLLDFLEPDAAVLTVGPERLWHRAETVYEQTERRELLRAPDEVAQALARRPHVVFRADEEGAGGDAVRIDCTLRDSFGPELDSTLVELERVCNEYEDTRVYCFSPAEAERFDALLKDSEFGAQGAAAGRGRPPQPRRPLPGGGPGARPPPPPLPPLPAEAADQPHAGRPAGGGGRGAGGRRAGGAHPARHRQVPRHKALGAGGPDARAPGDRVRGQGARLRPRRPHRDGPPLHRRRRPPAGAEQAARGDVAEGQAARRGGRRGPGGRTPGAAGRPRDPGRHSRTDRLRVAARVRVRVPLRGDR